MEVAIFLLILFGVIGLLGRAVHNSRQPERRYPDYQDAGAILGVAAVIHYADADGRGDTASGSDVSGGMDIGSFGGDGGGGFN